ncbi:MAG: FAD-dependent oxidoreductase [Alphaproteobacteria bacterium]|nr:FAD-dependent oxidoreductase [Alphaproteobacteria bacterium]
MVVEAHGGVLPAEDEEISALAGDFFEKQGMTIRTGATVRSVRKSCDAVSVTIDVVEGPEEFVVDRVLVAVGIVGNVEDLELENTGVVVDRTHVVVNPWLETGESGVYAIGDLAAPPGWLTRRATKELSALKRSPALTLRSR